MNGMIFLKQMYGAKFPYTDPMRMVPMWSFTQKYSQNISNIPKQPYLKPRTYFPKHHIGDPFGWYPPKRIERTRAGWCRGRYHTLENPSCQADVVSYSSAISACEEHMNFGVPKKAWEKWRKSCRVFDNMFPHQKRGLRRNKMFKSWRINEIYGASNICSVFFTYLSGY